MQFYVAHVIGDFAELEAKAFFTEHALPAMRGVVGKIDVDVASWKAVYKACCCPVWMLAIHQFFLCFAHRFCAVPGLHTRDCRCAGETPACY